MEMAARQIVPVDVRVYVVPSHWAWRKKIVRMDGRVPRMASVRSLWYWRRSRVWAAR
jgi:hypothetical protein